MIIVPIVSLAPKDLKPIPKKTDGRVRSGRKPLSHCKRGHALAGANLYILGDGHRRCAACRKIHEASRWDRHHNRRMHKAEIRNGF